MQIFLTALGNSSGEAFEVHFIGTGPEPVQIMTDGLVVEPLKKKAQKELRKQLKKIASKNPLTDKLNAYCLEFLRRPPSAGMMFRVADGELQKQFAPMRKLLAATRRLSDAGLLNPDSDPAEYFNSTRQWAIWTKENNFDLSSFRDAFVDRVKGNFKEANRPWNRTVEQAVGGLVPNRWRDIEKVLSEVARAEEQPTVH